MIRLGITGGIGSGKSTVAKCLERLCQGAILDADAISRQSTAPGGLAIPELTRIWGAKFMASDGGMNRPLVRQHAFSDPAFRQRLESIIHPIVQAEMERIEMECTARNTPVLIYDIPLLVESGKWRQHLHQVLVVDCSQDTQIQRVQSRSHMQAGEVIAVIRTQATRAHRLACADIVVCNDGISLPELEKQCQQVSNILRPRN